jgi:hypothetical protein
MTETRVSAIDLARRLLDEAIEREQSSARVDDGWIQVDVRREVRRLSRERGVRIRTGIVESRVVVILVSAALWREPAAVMRTKLGITDDR